MKININEIPGRMAADQFKEDMQGASGGMRTQRVVKEAERARESEAALWLENVALRALIMEMQTKMKEFFVTYHPHLSESWQKHILDACLLAHEPLGNYGLTRTKDIDAAIKERLEGVA